MSLREELAKRRATEPVAIHCAFLKSIFPFSREPSPPSIKICQWQSRSWVLPWSRFDDAHVSSAAGQDELVLSFSTHQVTATGANLGGLLDEISRFNVECLRNLPPEYRAKVQTDSPFIETLEVRPMSAVLAGRLAGESARNQMAASLNVASESRNEIVRASSIRP